LLFKWAPGLAALASSETLLDRQNVRPQPDLLDQNVRFNKIPGDTYARLILRNAATEGNKNDSGNCAIITDHGPQIPQSKIQETQGEKGHGSTMKSNQG